MPFLAGIAGTHAYETGTFVAPDVSPQQEYEVHDHGAASAAESVTEDQAVAHDAERVPYHDWFRVPDHVVGWRTFADGARRIEIYNANRARVETAMGVDLVYYNVAHGSFVMVQYKRMQREEHLLYRPDHNLPVELDRMRKIDEACQRLDSHHAAHVRLLSTPCLVKLCAPQAVVQDSLELITGMYLGREHFEALLDSDLCRGPRGGVQMTFTNVPRYLTNTLFASLLGTGWIGSRGQGSDYVGEQIRASLASGRSVVAGIDLTPAGPQGRRRR